MNSFAFLFVCFQACLIQNVYSHCLKAPVAEPCWGASPAIAAPYGAAYGSLAAPAYKGLYDRPACTNGGVGVGNVAVAGELPVAGTTAVAGQVPILGAVEFCGPACAAGSVSIAGSCGCGCGSHYAY